LKAYLGTIFVEDRDVQETVTFLWRNLETHLGTLLVQDGSVEETLSNHLITELLHLKMQIYYVLWPKLKVHLWQRIITSSASAPKEGDLEVASLRSQRFFH
jgi:hypothetical protein